MLRFADLKGYLIPALVLLFVFGLFASSPSVAKAQDDPPAEEKKDGDGDAGKHKQPQNRFVHFFVSIGWLFGIIFLVVSIGTVALIIVLLFDLKLSEAMNPDFVNEFTGLVNKRQFKQAFELCKNDSSFLARVMTAGMGRLQYGIEDAREAMIGMVETIKAGKEGLISYLASIGTLGPMLGLVGTVSGMIGAFYKLGSATKAPDASELAGEISHALVVTLVGVAVSVPAIFFYSFFKNRLTSISHHTGNLADDLLTQMYHNSKKQPATPTQPAS
jgi:biopolymer transport protein ExbB